MILFNNEIYIYPIYMYMNNMAQFEKLSTYVKHHSNSFPKLIPSLKALAEFVGHEDIKETVAKMVLFFISQCAEEKPLRRSKRSRKNTGSKRRTRRRILSSTSDDEDEDEDYDPSVTTDAKSALIALLTHTLQAGQEDSSDEDEEVDDPPFVIKCRERLKLLQGHFVHTLLLGKPGTGKTTFATLLVDVWDALGIIDKRRYRVTKRSDWVGKYQGHSVAKAKKLIESCKGGVIFIDEAYSIISSKDGDDMYGQEVLTEIVEAMSNADKQVIFIMAGYEKDMKQLFTYNAGLERRFGYVYRFKTPASTMIEHIFIKQLNENRWKCCKSERKAIHEFFGRNFAKLTHGGGSTNQLIFHSKQASVVRTFPEKSNSELTLKDLEDGMRTFLGHAQVFTKPIPPPNMYL
jgi:adenylate kinase family enzyme